MLALDPYRLDHLVRDWAGRHARFVQALAANGDAADHAFELVPAGVDEELYPTLVDASGVDPLAAPLARWLAFLLVEHASTDAARRVARRARLERVPVEAPERGELAYRDVLGRVLGDAPRRSAWLAALRASAPRVAEARFRAWERKTEAYHELRLAPLPLEDAERVVARMERFVAETDGAFAELRVQSLTGLLDAGVGAAVPGAFPSRLSTRGLAELFREGGWLDGIDFRLERTPEPAGASSFLRALAGFGSAWHDAGASRTRPFVASHDPLGRRRAAFGALFALLPLEPAFAARRLEIGKGSLSDYARTLGRVVLVGAREAALRALLARSAFDGRAAYGARLREDAPRVLGFELEAELAALFADELGLVSGAGLLTAAARARRLREAHDEDWFRNPRAAEELRAEIESPPGPNTDEAELDAGARELAGWLARLS